MAEELEEHMVGHVVIEVRDGHAYVSRFIETPNGDLTLQAAANVDALEADALAVLAQKGGGAKPIMGGRYTCPPELAARATWE